MGQCSAVGVGYSAVEEIVRLNTCNLVEIVGKLSNHGVLENVGTVPHR